MREIKFDLKNNPFIDFLSSRYSMSAKLDVRRMWKYSKENDLSFFVLSLAALMKAVNKVPQMKRRIVGDVVIQYDYMDAVCPLMDEEKGIFVEMRVEDTSKFDDIRDWYDYVRKLENDCLYSEGYAFDVDMMRRDELNIVNFSCIPWVDFDSITTCIATSNQIQPLITWGKVNEDYQMTVSITVNHIFVNGRELAKFFQYAQENFDDALGLDSSV